MTDSGPTATGPTPEPAQVFPPTLREVLLRPWWLGMLAFALVVAAVFAWLGQWQLGRAVESGPVEPGQTEIVQPIADVVAPGEYLSGPLGGQQVEAAGGFMADDFLVVSSRYNNDVEGYWVTGQFRIDGTAEPTSVAVAVGWTDDREEADAAASALNSDPPQNLEVSGRLIADEGPALPPRGAEPDEMTRMSPAALLSRWHDIAELNVYRPYLASTEPLGDLTAIDSPAPDEGSSVNWLNIFYAIEWAVFAGFAFYMWYRLGKDAWEKEVEELEDGESA